MRARRSPSGLGPATVAGAALAAMMLVAIVVTGCGGQDGSAPDGPPSRPAVIDSGGSSDPGFLPDPARP